MATQTAKKPLKASAQKRQPMGLFWFGFSFVALALLLMGVRNYHSYMNWKTIQQVVDAPEVFRTLHEKFPAFVPKQEPALLKSDIVLHPHDPAIGDVDADVQVVVFNDPGCPSCMAVGRKILELRRIHGDDVRVVYKFLPAGTGKGSMDAALFSQMAHSKGLFWVFHDRLMEAGHGDTETYAVLLEKLGISLEDQRNMLKTESEFLVRNVDAHIADAKKLGLERPPVIYVNTYQLGQPKLPADDFLAYVDRLLKGQPILKPNME